MRFPMDISLNLWHANHLCVPLQQAHFSSGVSLETNSALLATSTALDFLELVDLEGNPSSSFSVLLDHASVPSVAAKNSPNCIYFGKSVFVCRSCRAYMFWWSSYLNTMVISQASQCITSYLNALSVTTWVEMSEWRYCKSLDEATFTHGLSSIRRICDCITRTMTQRTNERVWCHVNGKLHTIINKKTIR